MAKKTEEIRTEAKIGLDYKGGFTQNPVTAYDPAYGQRQPSHRLRCPYSGEFSRFRPAYLKLV